MKDIEKLLQNPITNKIVKYVCENKKATTTDIAKAFPDISKATLYRYVKDMTDYDILEIVHEEKVQGQLQRTYSIKKLTISSDQETNNYMISVVLYLQQIYRHYELYFNHRNIDTKRDKLFMVSPDLVLDDTEYSELCDKIKELVLDYSGRNRASSGRVRNLYIMSAPDEEWEVK